MGFNSGFKGLNSVTQMVVHVYALIYTFSSYMPTQNLQFCQLKLSKVKDIHFTLKTCHEIAEGEERFSPNL